MLGGQAPAASVIPTPPLSVTVATCPRGSGTILAASSGTVLCAVALRRLEACSSETEAKRNVAQVVKEVAQELGNTPAVCRSCYIHPAVIEAYFESHEREPLVQALGRRLEDAAEDGDRGLDDDEAAVMRLLRRRLGA